MLKRNYMANFSPVNYVTEIIPCQQSRNLNIGQSILDKLNLFAQIIPFILDKLIL